MVEATQKNSKGPSVDLNQVLHLIGNFLKQQGLQKTFAQLAEEANLDISDNGPIGQQLENVVNNGEWPALLQLIENNSFKESERVFEAVYAHIIMELVLMDEKHLAKLILDE